MSLDVRQRLALVATVAFAVLAVITAGAVMLPFIVALLLALLLHPAHRRLRVVGLSPSAAAAVTTVAMTLATIGVVVVIVPVLAVDIRDLADTLLANARNLLDRASEIWGHWLPGLQPLDEALVDQVRELAPSVEAMAPALGSVMNVGGFLVSWIFFVCLVPVVLFFFLREGRVFRENAAALVPRRYQDPARNLALTVGDGLGNYLRGQALVCSVQAVFHATGLMLLGLQFGFIIGLLTGASAVIPIIGNAVMLSVALLVAVAQFESAGPLFVILAIYGTAQLIETLFLVPVLVGRQIAVHPLVMITAVLLGGRLFGFTGALLALPGTTVAVTAARWAWARYTESAVYVDIGPDDTPPEEHPETA